MYTIPFLLVLLLPFFHLYHPSCVELYGFQHIFFFSLIDISFYLILFFLSSVLRVSFTFTFLVGIEMTHNMCTIFHKIQQFDSLFVCASLHAHTHTHAALNEFISFSKYLQILANSHRKLWTRWCLAIELDFVLW